MKNLLTSLLLALPCFLAAQIYSYPLVDSLPNDAQVYHLPKTGLNLCFTIRHLQETPGELARYAERFLGQSDIITEVQNTQEIVSVDVCSYTIADPDMRFYITAPAKTYCNKDGILLAVNAKAQATEKADPITLCHQNRKAKKSKLSSQAYLTQEMKLANSSMKMAELAARQIFSIRETRLALLHGELENYPSDGEGFKKFLQELNNMEQQYLELFIGSRQEEVYQCYVQFVPNKDSNHEVVCRFSSQSGLLDKNDLSGRPIYCIIGSNKQNIVQTPDSISIRGKKRTEIIKKEEPAGLYYYQPEMVNISLKDGQQTLWKKDMMLAQMGQLLRLKSSKDMSVVLDAESGAIISR